jgi:hypothetical protein
MVQSFPFAITKPLFLIFTMERLLLTKIWQNFKAPNLPANKICVFLEHLFQHPLKLLEFKAINFADH